MARCKTPCRFCGERVERARFLAGYDYCPTGSCYKQGLRLMRPDVAVVAQHKSGYVVVKMEQVLGHPEHFARPKST